jgi:hypothetical protein
MHVARQALPARRSACIYINISGSAFCSTGKRLNGPKTHGALGVSEPTRAAAGIVLAARVAGVQAAEGLGADAARDWTSQKKRE